MDIKNISITVDDRERASGTVELLRDFSGVEVTVERLDIGDYSVDDCLLFERKTLSDFAVSVVQGRFFRQCLGLMESGRRGVIVLEGKAGDLVRFGIGREALQGALISASVIMGLAVLRSCGPQETVRLIVHAGRQAARHVSGSVPRHGYRPRGRRRRQTQAAAVRPAGPAGGGAGESQGAAGTFRVSRGNHQRRDRGADADTGNREGDG